MHSATGSDRASWQSTRDSGRMPPRRVVTLALLTQVLMIASALIAGRSLGLTPQWGAPVRDTMIGLAAAGALAASNYLLIARAPSGWIVDGVRRVFEQLLVPLFGRLDRLSIVVLGAAAGLGEEWLFRGILQPVFGLAIASVAFGLVHMAGKSMLPFAVWATAMGVVLGSLALMTGGLIAPMVAHGVYDMLALEYIRRGARDE